MGYNRAINREKPTIDIVEKELAVSGSFRSLVMDGFQKLLEFRAAHTAFSPEVPCKVLESQAGIFALYRGPCDGGGVLCVENFSPSQAKFNPGMTGLGEITIAAHGLAWIAFDSGGIRGELSF